MANNVRAYALAQAYADVFPAPIVAQRAPTAQDQTQLGRLWIDRTTNNVYVITSVVANVANWANLSGGDAVYDNLTVNDLTTLNGSINADPAVATDSYIFGNPTMTGNIIIGRSAAGQAVNISGSVNNGAQSVSIASGANAANSTVNIANGASTAGTNTVNIMNGALATNGTVNILSGAATAGTQLCNILGTGATRAATLNLGTGAAAHTVTLGSTTGAAATTIQAGTGELFLAAAGNVRASVIGDTQASPSATAVINARIGQAIFTGYTTAAAASQVFTITNSKCLATSTILVSASNFGANDAQMTVTRVIPGAGTFDVTVTNFGAAALNGNVLINFWILD